MQSEEMERWEGMRAELVKNMRLTSRPMAKKRSAPREEIYAKRKTDEAGVHSWNGWRL